MIDELAKKEIELAEKMGEYALDPWGFTMYAFPWGEEGTELEEFERPEPWQEDILKSIGKQLREIVKNFHKNDIENIEKATAKVLKKAIRAIKKAISSGHGIGKSALLSIIIMWAMSTKRETRGVVTANTDRQLNTKTWPELSKWYRMCITSHWFEYTATAIFSKMKDAKGVSLEKSWRIDAIPWSLTNTEAFAGLHNKGKRILLIMDEASAIPDKIWEVAEGALTDKNTEIIWLAFGNPTRNTGRFVDCFKRYRHRWDTKQIDSRSVSITDKQQFQEWVDDYGEDSDFVRVRVRGVFPRQAATQFIPTDLVTKARARKYKENEYKFAPVILGVDPKTYGDDEFVIWLRQGLYSERVFVSRELGDDDFQTAAVIMNLQDEYAAAAVFIDFGSGTGIVSAARQLGRLWTLVNFGSKPTKDRSCLNKRVEIWSEMKKWLKEGGRLPDDNIFEDQACCVEYTTNVQSKTILESKESLRKRGLESPNRPDALALTFSYPVSKHVDNPIYNRYDQKSAEIINDLKKEKEFDLFDD